MRSVALIAFPYLKKVLPYAVFLCVLTYIAVKLWSLDFLLTVTTTVFSYHYLQSHFFLLGSVLLLCPFNWGLEAAKWRVSTEGSSPSFTHALKGVLTGQALNLIIPGSIGHYAGRIVQEDSGHLEKVPAVFVCQVAQMAVTFLMSLGGICYFGTTILPLGQTNILIVLAGTATIIALIFAIFRQIGFQWLYRIKMGFTAFSFNQLCRIAMFSLLRYLVFTAQFVLMLYYFDVDKVWYELALAISLVFMAKSMMPSIHFMSDLGLREFCALLFLPSLGISESATLSASLLIWTINIVLPSFAGAFLILQVKLQKVWQ